MTPPLVHAVAAALGALALLLSASGCSPVGDELSRDVVNRTTFWTDDADTRIALDEAIGRLAEATGRRDLMVAPGGVPVSTPDGVWFAGERICGAAWTDGHGSPNLIEVDRNPPRGKCLALVPSMIHEAMHVLIALPPPMDEHSESGIFQAKAGHVDYIDEVSLSRLCEHFECAAFEPETH